MLELLTEDEQEIMYLLIQGHNFNGISAYLCIDYSTYKQTKRSLFAKLNINRATKILPTLFKNNILYNL